MHRIFLKFATVNFRDPCVVRFRFQPSLRIAAIQIGQCPMGACLQPVVTVLADQ